MSLVLAAWILVEVAGAGTISGTILDPEGEGLWGAVVVVHDQRLGTRWTTSGLGGVWQVNGLPDGPWRVQVLPPAEVNAMEAWLPGTLDLCEAEVFDVSDEPITGADLELERGGVIRGVLVDSEGTPVDRALVEARSVEEAEAQPRHGVSDVEGRWAVQGLPPDPSGFGSFVLRVEVQGWPRQVLPGAYQDADGQVFGVEPGDDLNVGEMALLDGITVGGAVVGPEGPLDQGDVHVYSSSQVVSVPVEEGRYLAEGLPPGDVLAWVVADDHAITYFPDADRPGERVQVVREGSWVDDVDLYPPAQSRLVGRIVGDGQDLSGVTVLAYNDDATVGVGATAAVDGSFAVERLHPGDYTLHVYAALEGYVSDRVRDAGGEPAVFPVPAEADSEYHEIELPLGSRVHGRVTDLHSGEPVYGAFVFATAEVTGESEATSTDRDGEYELIGLVDGGWELRVDYSPFCPSDQDWVGLYHPDRLTEEFSSLVRVEGGDEVEWSPRLPPDHDHDDMDDVWEEEHGLDPGRDDADEDPDGDGYSNLEEYRLGTDPSQGPTRGCGCGGGRSWMLLFGPLLVTRRRLRAGRLQNRQAGSRDAIASGMLRPGASHGVDGRSCALRALPGRARGR